MAQKAQLQNKNIIIQSAASQFEVTTGATAQEFDVVAAPSEDAKPLEQYAGIVSDLNTILEERDACGVSFVARDRVSRATRLIAFDDRWASSPTCAIFNPIRSSSR